MVKVRIPGSGGTKDHADANEVAIGDGHLFVRKSTSRPASVVAIYSPGHWAYAVVEEPAS